MTYYIFSDNIIKCTTIAAEKYKYQEIHFVECGCVGDLGFS